MLNTTDLLLIFPPQWSPYQPPLSLPAISAWLKRAGYSVLSVDFNIKFYEWLFSKRAVELLQNELAAKDWSDTKKAGFGHIISQASQFRADVINLASLDQGQTNSEYVTQYYLSNKALESYLSAVSEISEFFKISPYEFRLRQGNLGIAHLETLVEFPPPILSEFIEHCLSGLEGPLPDLVGISCIGQEQLYFSMLFGKELKRRYGSTILVGGTIFSRIFERGTLKQDWFGRYFDVVVRNEGEKPVEAILCNHQNGRSLTENVPGIVYLDSNGIKATNPATPLKPAELPTPDFDDMPLGKYFSSEITLPILSARGCYWGKCEFCHHGMVYGEKYEAYAADQVLDTVRKLSERYGVRHFAFNDEAIPPKIMRKIGVTFPPSKESKWSFTGLVKFENYFTKSDFINLNSVGFRSLYVGLESGSERVLALMKKNNTQAVMARNLKDASEAGIWMHSFVFFGFPGETENDAQQTYDFIMKHSGVMGSIGCGTFSLEHNAPIFRHLAEFGVNLGSIADDSVDVYYDYRVRDGIDANRALEWANRLNADWSVHSNFGAVSWVPREHMLCLIGKMRIEELVILSKVIKGNAGLPPEAQTHDVVSLIENANSLISVNRLNLNVLKLEGDAAKQFRLFGEGNYKIADVRQINPQVFARLALTAVEQPLFTGS